MDTFAVGHSCMHLRDQGGSSVGSVKYRYDGSDQLVLCHARSWAGRASDTITIGGCMLRR